MLLFCGIKAIKQNTHHIVYLWTIFGALKKFGGGGGFMQFQLARRRAEFFSKAAAAKSGADGLVGMVLFPYAS